MRRAFRICIVALLLLGLAWLVDLKAIVLLLKGTDWRWVLAGFAVVQIQVVLSAVRWQLTAVRLGQNLSVRHAVSEYFLATVANLSLPGGVGGDAARIYRNRHVSGVGTVAYSVILERLAGQIALLVVTILGWFMWPVLMHGSAPGISERMLMSAAIVVVAVGMVFVALSRLGNHAIAQFLKGFRPAIKQAWLSDRQWLVQGAISALIVASYLAVFACSAYAVREPLSFAALISIVPLVLLSMLIPLSVGGWGIRETAAASLWPLVDLSAETGVATSIVYGAISLLACLPGLALLFRKSRNPRHASA